MQYKIMIIENRHSVQESLSKSLIGKGYTTISTRYEGCLLIQKLIGSGIPDLILMDGKPGAPFPHDIFGRDILGVIPIITYSEDAQTFCTDHDHEKKIYRADLGKVLEKPEDVIKELTGMFV